MNENERNERIVREFLRKTVPLREWEYLGEVEHYWISQLCDELNKQLKAENAELRELCSALYEFAYDEYPDSAELNFADRMRELRIEA